MLSGFFFLHSSSLDCMVVITVVYIVAVFGFYGYNHFFNTHLYCLVGCLSMIVRTHAVSGVLYACVLYFCICTCSAQLSMFHMGRRPTNTLIVIIIKDNAFLLERLCSPDRCQTG